MFGHDDIETTATVVAITEKGNTVVNGKYKHEVVLDVAATDGPPFRVTTEHRFDILFSPNPGDVLRVSYDPKSHKTKIETDGDPRYDLNEHEKQRRQQGDAAIAAAMAQPAGTGTTPDPFAGAQYDPELAELVAEEQRQMAAQAAPPPFALPTPAPTPSPAPGVSSASFALPTPGATPTPATSPPAPDEPGRLQHLQMLRDGGLLTPEEFEILRSQLPPGS
jgi:hypothetical protein